MERDLNLLQDPFQSVVRAVLADLVAQGWTPYVSETLRDLERQKDLVARGLSRTMSSLHLTGEAVDIVDGRVVAGHLVLWGDSMMGWRLSEAEEQERSQAAEAFFAALGAAAEAHGLTWGGRWRWRDPAHVQARPT